MMCHSLQGTVNRSSRLISLQTYRDFFLPIIQMMKVRPIEVKKVAQGHNGRSQIPEGPVRYTKQVGHFAKGIGKCIGFLLLLHCQSA